MNKSRWIIVISDTTGGFVLGENEDIRIVVPGDKRGFLTDKHLLMVHSYEEREYIKVTILCIHTKEEKGKCKCQQCMNEFYENH